MISNPYLKSGMVLGLHERSADTAVPARVAAETPSFSSPSRTESLLVGF